MNAKIEDVSLAGESDTFSHTFDTKADESSVMDTTPSLSGLDAQSRKSFRRLTNEMVFNEEQAVDVLKMTSEERAEEAKRLKQKIARYRNLMYVVSLNTGWAAYATGVLSFALIFILKVSSAGNTQFMSLIGQPWNLKPLFGFLSDNFAIFGYR